jgi:hypothetical protein
MRRALVATLVAAALALPAIAAAGGWATVGLKPLPRGMSANEVWAAHVTVLQHGQTPLAGVIPKVIIQSGAKRVSYVAKPTSRIGVYVARVKFPAAGRWSVAVYDGFTRYGGAKTHTFGSFLIAKAEV